MGGKESKQFPISYDEASKRGEESSLRMSACERRRQHLTPDIIVQENVLFDVLFSKDYTSVIAVTDLEKRRLQDAFRRSSAANNSISKQVLIQDK